MRNPIKTLQSTAANYKTLDQKDKRRFWSDGILNNALYILMLFFCIYTAIQRPNFLSFSSLGNLIVQVAAYLPMALGIAGCIVLTGTDLSAGRAVGLTAAITGAFLQRLDYPTKMFKSLPQVTPMWMIATILGVIAVGAIIGLVNGFFVAKFSLHPFIVTLSTQLITFGIILWFFDLNGNNGAPIGGLDDLYKNFLGKTVFYMGKFDEDILTDEEVEQEIERLRESDLVKLARREARIRYRRRQFLYQLRNLEKKGKELMDAGITMEILDGMEPEELEEL